MGIVGGYRAMEDEVTSWPGGFREMSNVSAISIIDSIHHFKVKWITIDLFIIKLSDESKEVIIF